MRATTEFFKDRDNDKVIPPGEGVMGISLKPVEAQLRAELRQAEKERDEARYEVELMRQEKTALRLELDRALNETASKERK